MSSKSQPFQTVIFLHIPKTGGSTLRWIIAHQYKYADIFRLEAPTLDFQKSIEEFRNLPEKQRAGIKVLKGHMGFGLHEFLPQICTYITMLRDPVERVISFYYYARLKATRSTTLKDFIQGGGSLQVNNGQTRLLSAQKGNIEGDTVGYGQCSKEMLESAKQNLKNHFLTFGLLERFDESVLLFSKALGWKMPFYTKVRVNKTRIPTESISKETLNLIKEYNALDIELYQYAKLLFEEQVNRLDKSFRREYFMFKLLNLFFGGGYSVIRSAYRSVRA